MYVFKCAVFAQSNFLFYNLLNINIAIGLRKKYIHFVSFLQELLRITKKQNSFF